jgi:hypothetical protein
MQVNWVSPPFPGVQERTVANSTLDFAMVTGYLRMRLPMYRASVNVETSSLFFFTLKAISGPPFATLSKPHLRLVKGLRQIHGERVWRGRSCCGREMEMEGRPSGRGSPLRGCQGWGEPGGGTGGRMYARSPEIEKGAFRLGHWTKVRKTPILSDERGCHEYDGAHSGRTGKHD